VEILARLTVDNGRGTFPAMSDEDSPNRRVGDREAIELPVEYKRLNAFFADYTKNISKDGTFIKTNKPLGVGTEFAFKLYVPTLEKPIELRGQVRWVLNEEDIVGLRDTREPGMGSQFLYRDDSERRRLTQLVEKLMTESLGPLVYERLMEESKKIPGGGTKPGSSGK